MRRFLSGLGLAILAAGCSHRADRIVVGSGASTEQRVLGEVIAQQLERRTRLPIERRLGLDGALACHRAQVSGKIDVYPEYTLTALADILRHRAVGDPLAALNLIARESAERFHVTWLPPFGVEGRAAPVIRDEALRRHPEVRPALTALGGTMPDSALRRLVEQVDGRRRAPAEVVREFLAQRIR